MKRALAFYIGALAITYLVLYLDQVSVNSYSIVNAYSYIIPAILYSGVFAVAYREKERGNQ